MSTSELHTHPVATTLHHQMASQMAPLGSPPPQHAMSSSQLQQQHQQHQHQQHQQQPQMQHVQPQAHPGQVNSGTPKPISGDEIPPMHAIRVSTKGFRQRWNGQQWRRLCDEPTCLREAQRLSLCAKHQPIKDWRPSRRSGTSSTKKSSPKRGQRRTNPVDFQAALGMSGMGPHSMPLADPSLFPVDAGSLPMTVPDHDDQLGAQMHGGWPPMGSIPGYTLMPSAYPQQAYPYENPALLHLAAEQMAAAWSMQQPPPSHIPSQFIR